VEKAPPQGSAHFPVQDPTLHSVNPGDQSALRICSLAELPQHEGREFEVVLEPGAPPREIVLLRRGEGVVGYLNRCPHRGTPLNWTPDHFLDADGEHIVCATHGARFRIEDGECIAGPCLGDSLQALALRIRGGEVWLA